MTGVAGLALLPLRELHAAVLQRPSHLLLLPLEVRGLSLGVVEVEVEWDGVELGGSFGLAGHVSLGIRRTYRSPRGDDERQGTDRHPYSDHREQRPFQGSSRSRLLEAAFGLSG